MEQYIPFLVIMVIVTFIFLPPEVKKTIAKVVCGIIVGVMLCVAFGGVFYGALAEETRTVFVVGFDFETSEVLLEDEDGYIWTCPFGEFSWELGEEYELYLPDKGDPEIREGGK